MISGIFFYNYSGDLILGRFYKMNMRRITAETFRDKILIPKNFTDPITIIDGCSFLYLRIDRIYFVCATYSNCNVTLIFQFLYALAEVFKVQSHPFVSLTTIQQSVCFLRHTSIAILMKKHFVKTLL